MNWTSDAERNLFLLAGVLCLLLPPLGISSLGIQSSMLLLASHLLLLLYCGTRIRRRFAIASSLIIMLSLVNFLLANYSGLQHAELLIYLFCALALISIPFSVMAYAAAVGKAQQAWEYREKDEFRWLLTDAPLLARWKFLEILRENRVLQ